MQILVDEKARENLLWLAEDNNVSVSKLIRDLAEKEATIKKKGAKKTNRRDAVKMMLESAERLRKLDLGGPPDLSTNDDYIYG